MSRLREVRAARRLELAEARREHGGDTRMPALRVLARHLGAERADGGKLSLVHGIGRAWRVVTPDQLARLSDNQRKAAAMCEQATPGAAWEEEGTAMSAQKEQR